MPMLLQRTLPQEGAPKNIPGSTEGCSYKRFAAGLFYKIVNEHFLENRHLRSFLQILKTTASDEPFTTWGVFNFWIFSAPFKPTFPTHVLVPFLSLSAAASTYSTIYILSTAIGPVPSLSGRAIAYRWRLPPRARRPKASSAQDSSSNERVLPIQENPMSQ